MDFDFVNKLEFRSMLVFLKLYYGLYNRFMIFDESEVSPALFLPACALHGVCVEPGADMAWHWGGRCSMRVSSEPWPRACGSGTARSTRILSPPSTTSTSTALAKSPSTRSRSPL